MAKKKADDTPFVHLYHCSSEECARRLGEAAPSQRAIAFADEKWPPFGVKCRALTGPGKSMCGAAMTYAGKTWRAQHQRGLWPTENEPA